LHFFSSLLFLLYTVCTIFIINEKSSQRDANTARVLAVVRFGHCLSAHCHKPTDRTDYNTLHHSLLARSVIMITGSIVAKMSDQLIFVESISIPCRNSACFNWSTVQVKSCVLVCWWWRYDWSFARILAPVIT